MGVKRRGVLVGLAMLGSIGLMGGCSLLRPAVPTYRYRLTVEVDTPQGLRTGSSVIEVATSVASKLALRPGELSWRVRGEAVAVDLPGGKVLFALLSKPGQAEGAYLWALSALTDRGWRGWANEQDYIATVKKVVERRYVAVLPRIAASSLRWWEKPRPTDPAIDYPMLVTFTDLADPKTVAKVDSDDLAASFGPGVKLRRITVQMTDVPVTVGIEKRLGWVKSYYDRRLDGHRYGDSALPSNLLSSGNFTTELSKYR